MANYDEQAAIEAALAASLQTAQDDDKRRREKYGIISAIPVVPDSALKQTRPSSFTVGQQPGSDRSLPRSHLAQRASLSGSFNQRSRSTESPTPSITSPWPTDKDRVPTSEIARPRPRKSAPPGENLYNEFSNAPTWTPLNTMTQPPLPSVPPNAKNGSAEYAQIGPRAQTLGRPVKSNDSMNRRDVASAGSTPSHTSRPARPPPMRPKVDVSKKTHADDTDNLITLSPVGSKKDPFDFELSELDPLCGNTLDLESRLAAKPQMPPRPSSVPTVPTTQARQTNVPAARTPYYYDTLSATPKFVMPAVTDMSRALVPVTKPTSVNSPMSTHSTHSAMSDTNLNLMRPTPVPSNLPISLPNVSASNTPPSQTPVSSTSSDVGATRTLDLVQQRVRTSTPSTPGLASGDLMDFTEEKDMEELFSLEAFDPLYSVDLVTPSVEKEPATLFAGTSPQGLQSAQQSTPQNVPQVKPEEPNETSESSDANQEKHEEFELQDPFSISMLTDSLETKKKKVPTATLR